MKKSQAAPKTIDEYIAGFPPDVRRTLKQIRSTIRKAAPAAEEAIAYQMPTFRQHGNLVHFAAFKNHIGFYPAPLLDVTAVSVNQLVSNYQAALKAATALNVR